MPIIRSLILMFSLLASSAVGQENDSEIAEMSIGEAGAPVTMIEYASFTCPHCARFHSDIFPHLKEEYVDTGKVRLITREVYFDRFGLWASMVARCGDAERFFAIQDLIYEQQAEWTSAGDPAAIAEELKKIGALAGLERDELDACLSDVDQAEALVGWYQSNATQDGVQSTPSFVIQGELHSNMPWDDMKALLDEAIEKG